MALPYAISMSGVPLADGYSVRSLTMADGLGHIFVDDMLIDSQGFLWIATAGGGLSRYDSYGFVEFGPDKENRMLKGNFVIKIAEDAHRRLWVAAREGLDVIDMDMLAACVPEDRSGKLSELMSKRTFYVSVDALGRIWVNNIDGLACISIDGATGAVEDIYVLEGVYHEPHLLAVEDVQGDGCPWAMIGGTVCRMKLIPDGKIGMSPVSAHLDFSGSDIAASCFVAKDSDVWIGTNMGVLRYNTVDDKLRHYKSDYADPRSLTHDYVTSIAVLDDGRLIVGSSGGIDAYSAMGDDFERLSSGIYKNKDVKFVNSLLSDGGLLWVGTERKGIKMFIPRKFGMKSFVHDSSDPSSISSSPVNAVYQDVSGDWWIGTSEYGLNKADPQFRRFEHYSPANTDLSNISITDIDADGEGRIWLGTWGRGIDVVDRDNPGKILAHVETPTGSEYVVKYVTMLMYDFMNDLMWIGTNQGLMTYDVKSGAITEPFDNASKSEAWMLGGVIDPDGILWLGGKYGLYKINLKSRKPDGTFDVVRYKNRLDDPDSNVIERVSALCLAADGSLWIGSNGNGLYKRNLGADGSETFTRYSIRDGLPGDIITGLHEDSEHRLWVVTTKGLACRQPDGSYVSYDSGDGMLSNLFCENASAMGADGLLVFGTTDGLVVIDPSRTSNDVKNHEVRFTGFVVDGVGMKNPLLAGDDGKEDGLVMHERDKSLEISFSALDYERSRYSDGRYICRLTGFDSDWDTLATGRHYVRYTNLPPGNYRFDVRYQPNGSGASHADVASVDVKVVPYFYKRWWFIMLAVLVTGCCVFMVYRWRVNDLTRQKRNLQITVDRRTQEIGRQKQLLESQNQRLRDANLEVTRQKTQLSEMVEQVQNLTNERLNFFTSITHEFRTPVTLILGPVRRALKLSGNPQVIEQLNFVEQNSRYLLSLINQIMDFRKLESGRMSLAVHTGNFVDFINEVTGSFIPMARDLGVNVRVLTHVASPEFCFSEDAMRKILVNLLSNALKYTPRGGDVAVYVALLGVKAGSPMLYMCVSDSGIGISESNPDKLFDRFYQGGPAPVNPVGGTSGSGIGLYLCRSIAETCGGTITARNNRRSGCSMRVLVPVGGEETSLYCQPVSVEPDTSVTVGPVEHVEHESKSRRLTVLVVEDNTAMRKFIRSVLEDSYAVVEASNGKEALSLLVNNTVDFIISDLMMPVMDGHELSRRLKSDISTSHIPLLILTAKVARQSQLESYMTGVDEYLSKPFDEELLLARIANILENKRRYQSRFVKDMDVDSLNVVDDSLDRKFLDRMMAAVKENYRNSEFEVADLAEALGVGRNVLNQKLQSLVGQSAWQFIRTYRLSLAHEMILKNRHTRTMNISEIAYEVGFSDPKYFSKSFSKHFGISPRSLMNGEGA